MHVIIGDYRNKVSAHNTPYPGSAVNKTEKLSSINGHKKHVSCLRTAGSVYIRTVSQERYIFGLLYLAITA